jgi:hypothetical protein
VTEEILAKEAEHAEDMKTISEFEKRFEKQQASLPPGAQLQESFLR